MASGLLIRRKAIPGESLTSLLMRLAFENGVSVVDLWEPFNDKYKKTHLKDVHQLDIDPYRVCDISTLQGLLMTDDSTLINKMTFQPLFEKFLDEAEIMSDASRRDFCLGLIETAHRRYCPVCISENPVYKLLWQVKEIEICDVHRMKLESSCPHCGVEQDLVHSGLVKGRCQACNMSLAPVQMPTRLPQNHDEVQTVYLNWTALIDPARRGAPEALPSLRKSLAIAILFIEHEYSSNSHIKGLTNETLNKLARFIRDQNGSKRPTLNMLLQVLRQTEMTFSEFEQLQIPELFIESICGPSGQQDVGPGACSTPWCTHLGSSVGMTRMNLVNGKLKGADGDQYTDLYLCTGCSLRYGSKLGTGVWGELDGMSSFGVNKVLPRLNKGESKRQISIDIGITSYKITQIAGYFAQFDLLSKTLLKDYLPVLKANDDAVSYFKPLWRNGTLIYQACREYGWTQGQFWYLYYKPEVQQYLFLDVNRQRGQYKSDDLKMAAYRREKFVFERKNDMKRGIQPNLNDIARRVGCAKETLTRYKLSRILTEERYNYDLQLKDYYWSMTKEFVGSRLLQHRRIILTEYYGAIGKSEKWLKKRFPDIVTWIKGQIPIASANHKSAVLAQRVEQAKQTVRELFAEGSSYDFAHVAERMGIELSTIYYYPEIADAIREAAVTTK
ncbi:TniQ family protein [Alicyclobacillus curvatus]|nr:TniQ family protein [Alicyclobacillus curvatus]